MKQIYKYIVVTHVGGLPGDSWAHGKAYNTREEAQQKLNEYREEQIHDNDLQQEQILTDNKNEFYFDNGEWWEYTTIHKIGLI
jgi:hypothetical protein